MALGESALGFARVFGVVFVDVSDLFGLLKSKTTLLFSPNLKAAENSLPVRCDLNPLTTFVLPLLSNSLIIVCEMVRVEIFP